MPNCGRGFDARVPGLRAESAAAPPSEGRTRPVLALVASAAAALPIRCHLPEVGQVINESAKLDSFGHVRLSGIGEALAELIEEKTGFETRSVNLGHTQRGGVPTAYDRLLGQRYGLHAIDMVHDKKWGRIAVLKGLDVTDITIKEAIATNRRLDQRFFDVIADLEAKV